MYKELNVKKMNKVITITRNISMIVIEDNICAFRDEQVNSEDKKVKVVEGIALKEEIENVEEFEPIAELPNVKLARKIILKHNRENEWSNKTKLHEAKGFYFRKFDILRGKPYTYLVRLNLGKEKQEAILVEIRDCNLYNMKGEKYPKLENLNEGQ